MLCHECLSERNRNVVWEEENRLQDRLAGLVHGKIGTEGKQKAEKVNEK